MEITGILMRKVGERSGVSQQNGNPWCVAEFLVEIPGQYPRNINFQVQDGQVDRIKRFESMIGKTVTVSFDIDAHEYQGRWFNEIKAWGIVEYVAGRKTAQTKFQTTAPEQDGGTGAAPAQEQPATGDAPQPQNGGTNDGGSSDGLPF